MDADPRKTETEKQMDAGTYVPTPDSELIRVREQHLKALTALASVVLELSGPDNPLSVKTQREIRYALTPYLMYLDIRF